MDKKLPIIAIIGRTNVGKSTLFNLLVKNKAIVSSVAGTTRDANYQEAEWLGKKFMVVDTGGLEEDVCRNIDETKLKEIEKEIIIKTKSAIENSDLVLFLTDAQVGIMPQDKEFASYIKKNKLNYILVANKCHSKEDRNQSSDFCKLGLGEPIQISAASGSGVGDLLDVLVKKMKLRSKKYVEPKSDEIKITFIGKTNVGKSSLINAILNENRVIVSEQEHTTRDAQFIPFEYKEKKFILIDTAGVRKNKLQIKKDELEFLSVRQTKQAVKKSDIIILTTDVSKELSVGDMKFAEMIKSEKKGLLIIANKWDLIEDKDLKSYNKYVDYYNMMMPFLSWAKILPVSAKSKQRTLKILDESIAIMERSNFEINRSGLDKFLKKIIKIHKPTIGRGTHKPRIYEIKQVQKSPLTFEVLIGAKTSLNDSYLKFIEKKLRETFSLQGVPVITYVRKIRTVAK